MSEPVDLVRLFQLYTFSLQSGQNVPEANAWLTGFLSVESCLEVLLHILGMANDDTCSKFFAAKMIHSLLKNASWTRIHHHRLGEICQVFISLYHPYVTSDSSFNFASRLRFTNSSPRYVQITSTDVSLHHA